MILRTAGVSLALASIIATAFACSSSADDGNGGGNGTVTPTGDGGTTPGGDDDDDSVPPPPPPPPPPSVAAACEAYAAAACTKLQSCGAFGVPALYGDLATCEERWKLLCTTGAVAPGQAATADTLTECAASVPALTCDQVTSYDSGPKCRVPGTLTDGAPCGYDAQCASTFCAIGPDKACGKCAPLTKDKDACVNGACSPGTACGEDDSKCHTILHGKPGDHCDRFYDCDVVNASGCNTLGKKCLALELSQNGKCGADNPITPKKFTACPASGNCSSVLGGNCGKIAKEGESCSATGNNCLPPARCVSGKCALPSIACQ